LPRRSPGIRGIRYGIAELFGFQIDRLPTDERKRLLSYSVRDSISSYPPCPFRLPDKRGNRRCTKRGGVCSIRRYMNQNGLAERMPGAEGALTVTCPNRFHEEKVVFKWVGEHLLEVSNAEDLILSKEVYFLERPGQVGQEAAEDEGESEGEDVGRIDLILVDRRSLAADYLR
jgi:hypothetical protein